MTVGAVLVRVADAYGIQLRPCVDLDGAAHHGPAGHALCLETRTVFVDYDQFADGDDLAAVFHELMHVICHPPGFHLDDVCEDLCLLQFERTLARVLFARRHRDMYLDVCDWQDVTQACADMREIGTIPHLMRQKWWRDGFKVLRNIGLLDESNKPTWRQADWSCYDEPQIKEMM